MTWGGLRLQLQTSAPGVSPDLIDEVVNSRYEQVLESCDWKGLQYNYTLQTTAAYQSSTDSVTLTVGSTAVTGVGTSWVTGQTGRKLYRPGDSVVYTFTFVGAASATLDRPYEGNGVDASGTVYTGAAYVLMQNVYQLPSDVRTVVAILGPDGFPLTPFSEAALDASAGPRTLVQDPASYAVYADSPETSPPVVHQVELFPPPIHARGLMVQYLHAATGFDGGNTSDSPLPWVSTTILLYGCRADLAAYLAAQVQGGASAVYLKQAQIYEAKFQEELMRLLRVEHQQRRPKVPIRMATRFTRHRMARAARGMNNSWGPGQGGPN